MTLLAIVLEVHVPPQLRAGGSEQQRRTRCKQTSVFFAVLSDPLISLIDTAAVGQVSSLEVGALGPCSSLFFLCFVLTSFTGSAVTNILASAQTNPAMSPQVQELRRDR